MTDTKLIKQCGFTLLEVLIALIILAIGLLGLAGLQATGLNMNHSAYNRSQATQLAYDIADRMRSNLAAINTNASIYVITDSRDASSADYSSCMSSPGCNASDMAGRDLYEWNLGITNSLPDGIGSISASGAVYTISINWDDNRDGDVNTDDPNFQLSVQP